MTSSNTTDIQAFLLGHGLEGYPVPRVQCLALLANVQVIQRYRQNCPA
jgi:hypothetical protein